MMASFLRRRSPAGRGLSARAARCRPVLEALEERLVPYALSGYVWANANVSVSYMPDGTLISSSYPSNLFATYNAAYPMATWQYEFARALQSWADVSNLNFHFVPDDGSAQGTAGLAQGNSRFGDIRIGGYNMGSGILGIGWNPGSTTTAGDVELNTNSAFPMGSMPDLFSVVLHEVGHGVGFNHSLVDPAVMEGGLWGVYPGPYADDIAGIQAMYGTRRPDIYDTSAANDTLASATSLTLSYGGVAVNADLTTMADVDNYRVLVPSGSDGTMTVSVDARNLSLLTPKISIYDSSGTLVATASASTYGDVATLKLTGLVAGQTYYLQADGATTDVFGMGAYRLSAQFGGITPPPIGPDSCETNNTVTAATKFGTVTSVSQTSLTLHNSTDMDYYTAAAGSKATYTVTVTPTLGSGTLSLAVLGAQQTVLASGQSQTGGVTLSVSLLSGQQYYVKVCSPTGSLFGYSLSIAKASGGGGGSGGGHHLVVMGVESPDDKVAGDVFYQNAADDPDNPGFVPHRQRSASSHTQTSDAALATGVHGGVALLAAAGAIQDGAGSLRNLFGVLPHLEQPIPLVPPVMAADPAAVAAAPARGSPSMLLLDLRPPISPVQIVAGDGGLPIDEAQDDDPAAGLAPRANPADTPVEGDVAAQLGVLSRERACDACFVQGSWRTECVELSLPVTGMAAKDADPAPDAAIMAAALAVVLGGCRDAHRADLQLRRQRRFRLCR